MAERRNRRNITLLYGEHKLQNTISLPATTTVRKAKEVGSIEMIKHLQLQSGVPQDITIDNKCTDVYPSMIQLQNMMYSIYNDDTFLLFLSCSRQHFVARSRRSSHHGFLAKIYNCPKCPHPIPYNECAQQQNLQT
jgi:hypothetical protein